MSEQKQNKTSGHEILRQSEERENTTLIWRKSGNPVGSSVGAGDRRFLRRALIGSAAALLALICIGVLSYYNIGQLRQTYAALLIQQGKYRKAEEILLSLTKSDAQESLLKRNYFACGRSLEQTGNLSEAVRFYQAAGDYPNAAEALQRTGYALAQIYEADGDYREASETYTALGDYLDAVEKSEFCSYAYAIECYENGNYNDAMRLFYALGGYADAESYAKKSAAALSKNAGAGDLVSLLVGLTDEQLQVRARLKSDRDALPKGIVATGYKHTIAKTESGSVLSVGSNLSGQCNTTEWSNIVAVAAGAYHSVGLRSDGTVVAAGSNAYGQCDVTGWKNVVSIYAGAYNTVGITQSGEILNAGYQRWNTLNWREIGSLSIGDYSLNGVMENGQPLSTHSDLITSDYYDLVAFDAATANSAGLKADGSVVSNGLDTSGLSNILSIDCTPNGLYALDDTGRVMEIGFRFAHLPDVSDWTDVVAISANATFVVGVTKNGRVLARGSSDMGQCDTQDWVLFTPVATPEPIPASEP
ncbi:MAG: hypothetical protein LLF75_08605 [Eubacteriales bacterium]|nr:hypothetical protein [Eubacteriales bacterium]